MTRQEYYPVAISAQVLWLRHFAETLPLYNGVLAIQTRDMEDAIADARWLAHVLGTWRTELRRLALAGTAAIEQALTVHGHNPQQLPVFDPVPPEGILPRPPGGLRRLFQFIRVIKSVKGYDESIGSLLGILPKHDTREFPVPTFKIRVATGPVNQKVILRYSRHDQPGVFIQCQVGEGQWDEGRIAMGSVHEDTRPLQVPGEPEVRHYRMRYWDGKPFGDWTDVATVTVGP